MPSVNAFDCGGQGSAARQLFAKESLYEKILQNKSLDDEYFEDSSTEEDSDNQEPASDENDSGSDEVTNSFKFNKDHCLNVFNILKSGGAPNNSNGSGGAGGNQFERGYNNQGAYVNLNG